MATRPRRALICTGADGVQRTFEYEYEKDQFQQAWHFRVYTSPPPQTGQFFECNVEAVDAKTVRVVAIAHHGASAYRAMGIPDELLPEIAAVLGRRVVSSSNLNAQAGEWRTPDAGKVWNRLRSKGRADYDPVTDRFHLL
jgi:hypothetical protein